jgi:hypothetical protein
VRVNEMSLAVIKLTSVPGAKSALEQHPAPFETVAPRPPQGEDFS